MAALLSWSGANAFAAQITITGNGNYRQGRGGEFNVRAADAAGAALIGDVVARGYVIAGGTTFGTANGTAMEGVALPGGFGLGFETFCIEINQFISLPGTYDASISLGARPGGAGGDGTVDNISIGTAFLYSQFAAGSLAGYTYANGSGRAASAENLQKAIWFMEDEIDLGTAGGIANIFLNAVITQFGSLISGQIDNNIFDVAALNLGARPGFARQDQLIMHDNGFSIPDPVPVPDGGMTVMLLGLGLTGLGLMRRQLA